MYSFNTLQVCYRHIEDVHEDHAEKIIFDKFTAFLNLIANFRPLYILNNG